LEVNFIVAQPTGKSKKFKLCLGEYVVIGRSSKAAQVTIIDDLASNSHCRVSIERNQIQVEDLNSKNGVFLNGVKIIKQRMFIKDKVKIGDSILYINQERLDEDSTELLTYTGTHIRSKGGFTLELDSSILKSVESSSSPHSITTEKSKARKKAYVKQRVAGEKIMSSSKLHFLEQCAFIVDLILSIVVFIVGIGSFYVINSETLVELEEQYPGYQIIFSDEMSLYTLGSILISIALFTVNRGIKSGSFGERVFRIN
jgi:pSer/pThr/pTyr-binding forkhead associated (FHA) protein